MNLTSTHNQHWHTFEFDNNLAVDTSHRRTDHSQNSVVVSILSHIDSVEANKLAKRSIQL